MVRDSLFRQHQPVRDLGVAQTFSEQFGDLEFLGRESLRITVDGPGSAGDREAARFCTARSRSLDSIAS